MVQREDPPTHKDRQGMGKTFVPLLFKQGTQSPAEQPKSKRVEDDRYNNEGYAP